ncbi:hypothetical protein N7475_008737 [Penicillium sp. IBT 31633x]|nr:hypothetical protein N7475_008737 [Penicillium sp. IBT 31633x]
MPVQVEFATSQIKSPIQEFLIIESNFTAHPVDFQVMQLFTSGNNSCLLQSERKNTSEDAPELTDHMFEQ